MLVPHADPCRSPLRSGVAIALIALTLTVAGCARRADVDAGFCTQSAERWNSFADRAPDSDAAARSRPGAELLGGRPRSGRRERHRRRGAAVRRARPPSGALGARSDTEGRDRRPGECARRRRPGVRPERPPRQLHPRRPGVPLRRRPRSGEGADAGERGAFAVAGQLLAAGWADQVAGSGVDLVEVHVAGPQERVARHALGPLPSGGEQDHAEVDEDDGDEDRDDGDERQTGHQCVPFRETDDLHPDQCDQRDGGQRRRDPEHPAPGRRRHPGNHRAASRSDVRRGRRRRRGTRPAPDRRGTERQDPITELLDGSPPRGVEPPSGDGERQVHGLHTSADAEREPCVRLPLDGHDGLRHSQDVHPRDGGDELRVLLASEDVHAPVIEGDDERPPDQGGVHTREHLISGDIAAGIRALKDAHDGELLLVGSARLARRLLEWDLVDEINLVQFPVILGDGERLFPAHGSDHALELLDTRVFDTGVLGLTYRVAGRPAYA
ncbi:hypothetical protein DVJ78_02030 [Humibacter sp. BT305]|nr:hypothetical protein DVJ78_02030 [Humibacter sp. BT305]